ncbi:helix-turn-helix transcriptional regulator [uncultured Senegalimassilia sp.]|uniref:helix-turn-helix domain-containing protein n=1 Tax=uncultured Senegalimassilia sp. TaxID=1714350 RepID=UPI0027DAF3A6|nr:helix-turn-helix transcriptional regulator [uncultured Senegalimassilia sp.]
MTRISVARTRISNIAHTFKPNTASLGYALFLAINAAGVWGGVFPFLPMNFQTPEVMFWFFLMQSLVFSLCYFASAIGVYYLPGPTRRFMVMLASAPYLLGWCCLIGAIYLHGIAQALVIAGGSLLGLGSAGFYMLWQRLFASFDADHGNHDLILGTAYGALLYFALYAIPQAVTAFLIPLVFMPLFALAIVLKSRHIDLKQPMFEDVPREHPNVYRRVLRDYWRSALCVGAIAFRTGVMRSLAIGEPRVGSLVNLLSMTGCLVAGIGVLVLWQFKNVRMNVANAYRIAFPLLITSFLVLPFCSGGYARWQAAILYAVYSVAIALMMIQCAQASRDRGINPVFIYGFFAGIVYALHDVGFLAGTFAEQIRVIGMQPDAVVALVAVYLLGLMFFIGQGGFKRALAASQAEDIELVAGAPLQIDNINERQTDLDEAEPESEASPAANAGCAGPCPFNMHDTGMFEMRPIVIARAENEGALTVEEPAMAPDNAPFPTDAAKLEKRDHARSSDVPNYQDRLSKQAALVRQHYRLSARETEVMELIARGNTVARIAEQLVVSENTIRTHSKRIYAKLDIHKKQELVDLLETFNPKDLED